MKVLSTAEMREVDRITIESGIPGIILMENAGSRVVEFLVERYSPLSNHRIVVVCGKGNNGGDGLVIARQLFTRFRPKALDVFLDANPAELTGDAAANYRMFLAAGGHLADKIETRMGAATIVVDALLGTGLRGPAGGSALQWIRAMNTAFPAAKVVAVDIPSGLVAGGEFVRADHTVTFTAPKEQMVVPPLAGFVGELIVARIGSPDHLLEPARLHLSQAEDFEALLAPRPRDSHKGTFGHALIVGGAPGKTGAAQMAGLAALRSGAGLVTVASAAAAPIVPELMTGAVQEAESLLERKTVIGLGPGLGTSPEMVELARRLARHAPIPVVIDADGLNALAGLEQPWPADAAPRILTPHPGEMARLALAAGADRVQTAREFAIRNRCAVVLKGDRTVIAFADGNVWINPTGSPALAKGGSGDILTGMITGFIAQFPNDWKTAVRAAVYLHGRAGELAARLRGDKGVLATNLLDHLFTNSGAA